MSRREFPPKVRLAAFQRAAGHCEGCTARLVPGRFHYDHDLSDAMGGEPVLSNCKVLCTACHGTKTATVDIPTIAKSNRVRLKHAGISKASRMPGSRASGWKRKLDGTVVRRHET